MPCSAAALEAIRAPIYPEVIIPRCGSKTTAAIDPSTDARRLHRHTKGSTILTNEILCGNVP